jgi:hypothetical protein
MRGDMRYEHDNDVACMKTLLLSTAAVAAAGLLCATGRRSRADGARPKPSSSVARVRAARTFHHSSALLALSVLSDSAMEHYRGTFHNPAMWAPLVSSLLELAAGLHGGRDDNAWRHRARDAVHIGAAAVGIAGTGFHLYNVTRLPGGLSWNNLFYGAPLGAPSALILSGLLGATAERLRDGEPLHLSAGQAVSLVAAAGLLGTVGEVALLHFRGSFQHRAMYAPVVLPPLAAAALARAALLASPRPRRLTRWWLRLTAALGLAGMGFHARGIARQQGGWANWSQNLFSGPPLPAPPSFTALAIAGLGALQLRETER